MLFSTQLVHLYRNQFWDEIINFIYRLTLLIPPHTFIGWYHSPARWYIDSDCIILQLVYCLTDLYASSSQMDIYKYLHLYTYIFVISILLLWQRKTHTAHKEDKKLYLMSESNSQYSEWGNTTSCQFPSTFISHIRDSPKDSRNGKDIQAHTSHPRSTYFCRLHKMLFTHPQSPATQLDS